MTTLQHLALPKKNTEDTLYYSTTTPDKVRIQKNHIQMGEKAHVDFCSYYNLFNLKTWRQYAEIGEIYLVLEFSGVIELSVYATELQKTTILLQLNIGGTEKPDAVVIKVPVSDGFQALIHYSISAVTSSVLRDIRWATEIPPKKIIKLGVVITHYNREAQIQAAIREFRKLVKDSNNCIQFVIIDNSRTLNDFPDENITVIKNSNYGGSGGFSRGLLYLEQNNFTHCLFIDDDASCEIHSILLTFMFLSYTKDKNTAISGTLFKQYKQTVIAEKGAHFTGYCRTIYNDFDMANKKNLVHAELIEIQPDYGGWWFFAFELKNVTRYPFPFFVRGDDVMFSMTNKFQITSLNGIGCWGEEFSHKHSPLTNYLDLRSHLVHILTFMDFRLYRALKVLAGLFINALLSYQYASANACILGIEHVIQGYDFFDNNLAIQPIIDSISLYEPFESMQDYSRSVGVHMKIRSERSFRRFFRILTLNGLLIPDIFFHKDTIIQNKGFRASFREIFRYKKVFYIYKEKKTGYIARFDRKHAIRLLLRFSHIAAVFCLKYRLIKKHYQDGFEYHTCREYWNRIYDINI